MVQAISLPSIESKMPNQAYTQSFFEEIQAGSRSSAQQIVPIIMKLINPSSVVDVGCGSGEWLSTFQQFGVREILGLDGEWVNPDTLSIPRQHFQYCDLLQPVSLKRRFDLVVSLEVGEHLPKTVSDQYIESLTNLGSTVLFSAAIPYQGGVGHINEQWPEYWGERFKKKGYTAVDCIRQKVWTDKLVECWYSQNIFLFVQDGYQSSFSQSQIDNPLGPLSLVHPQIYMWKVEELNDRSEAAERALQRLEPDNISTRRLLSLAYQFLLCRLRRSL
jgi:hypothetical protein